MIPALDPAMNRDPATEIQSDALQLRAVRNRCCSLAFCSSADPRANPAGPVSEQADPYPSAGCAPMRSGAMIGP